MRHIRGISLLTNENPYFRHVRPCNIWLLWSFWRRKLCFFYCISINTWPKINKYISNKSNKKKHDIGEYLLNYKVRKKCNVNFRNTMLYIKKYILIHHLLDANELNTVKFNFRFDFGGGGVDSIHPFYFWKQQKSKCFDFFA